MAPKRQRYPIGIQSFAKIRTGGFYYVDKTPFALSLANGAGFFFLSRPRRFGKSLFLDTLKELFEGNEALFQGLAIHGEWDWATRFPVVQISFNDGGINSAADLERRIRSMLEDNCARLGLPPPDSDDTVVSFGRLVRSARARFGQPVVVLVDEYDKPILDNLHQRDAAAAIRDMLKGFYSVIKGLDADIRFAMVTGVSKFSKVSLFSGLNNLECITLDPAYSAICGYTDTEVDAVFPLELPGLDRDEIRRWYNGYNWLGEPVYNPFDLLLLFKRRQYRHWWFQTATPTFLVKLLIERQVWLPSLRRVEADSEVMDCFDVDNLSTTALMFQTGYLTIKSEELVDGEYLYQLGFPNYDVYHSFHRSLLGVWTGNQEAMVQNRSELGRLLARQDAAGMERLFKAFFSSIPYHWHVNNEIAHYEGYYASVFYGYFAALGLDVQVEDVTSRGRIDMAVRHSGHVWLFEFKVRERTPAGGALQQIKDKGYADKYRAEGLPIHLVGVEFSLEQRNVVGFEVALA